MSKLTEVLKLLCYDPETDGNLTFNVTEALTKNWEKIDAWASGIKSMLNGKASLCENGAVPVSQGGTGATTAQTALAALGAGVRPNLLDNAYFVGGGSQQGSGQLPINQKGKTSYADSVYAYTIDRWKASSALSALLDDDYVQISAAGTTGWFEQFNVDLIDKLAGKTVTISALLYDGTLLSASGTLPETEPSGNTLVASAFSDGLNGIRFYRRPNDLDFQFQVETGSQLQPVAAKLEEGEGQTLAYQDSTGAFHLLPQPESDYATQLLRCQRHYEQTNYFVFYASALNATEIQFGGSYQFKAEKRIMPTIIVNPTPLQELQVRDAETGILVSGCTLQVPTSYNKGMLCPRILSDNFVQGKLYRIHLPDNAYLVSAEL